MDSLTDLLKVIPTDWPMGFQKVTLKEYLLTVKPMVKLMVKHSDYLTANPKGCDHLQMAMRWANSMAFLLREKQTDCRLVKRLGFLTA